VESFGLRRKVPKIASDECPVDSPLTRIWIFRHGPQNLRARLHAGGQIIHK